MKKHFLNPLRALTLFTAVIALVFTMSCGEDGDDEPEPTLTLAQTVDADAELTTIAEIMAADAELQAILEGSADYTVFLPTNNAMEKLKATLQIEDFSSIAPSVIGQVLRFHFVAGIKTATDLEAGSLTSNQGESISLRANGNIEQAGSDSDGSEILEANIRATNGIAHKLETVLIPPTLFAQIGANLGTLGQPVLLSSGFTGVASIIATADSDVPAGETSITAMLTDKTATLTCFMPANNVLDAVAASQEVTTEQLIASVSTTPAAARAFILNHIVASAKLKGSDMVAGETVVTTEAGTTLALVETEQTEQTPLGLALVNAQDQTKVTALFLLDAYDYTPEGSSSSLGAAINGSLHVSSIVQ